MSTARSSALIGASAWRCGWTGSARRRAARSRRPPHSAARPRPLGVPPASAAPFTRATAARSCDEQPRSPTPGRNPFVFGARRAGCARRRARRATAMQPRRRRAPAPPLRRRCRAFKLVGHRIEPTRTAPSCSTAILIDNGAMVFAKAGDKLSDGYSVVRVDETVDRASSTRPASTQTLRLRKLVTSELASSASRPQTRTSQASLTGFTRSNLLQHVLAESAAPARRRSRRRPRRRRCGPARSWRC